MSSCLALRWQNDATGVLCPRRELVLDLEGLETAGSVPIQIASDLHLEFYSHPSGGLGIAEELDKVIVPSAPVLVLLGDIGIPTHPSYRHFLLLQAQRFEAVLVLSGNHEFYDTRTDDSEDRTPTPQHRKVYHSVENMENKIEAICAESPGLHYVDNTCVRFGHAPNAPTLLCTPLWSHVPEHAAKHIGACMNDYSYSYIQSGGYAMVTQVGEDQTRPLIDRLSPEITSCWHHLAVQWLQAEIERLKLMGCDSIGIMSHHTPSFRGTSDPRHDKPGNLASFAFSTDLSSLYWHTSAVRLWAYGHTHYNNDRIEHGTRLISNQRGYDYNLVLDYRPDLVVVLSANQSSKKDTRTSAGLSMRLRSMVCGRISSGNS